MLGIKNNTIINNLHIYFLCFALYVIEEKTFYIVFQDYAIVVGIIASLSFFIFAFLYLIVYQRNFLRPDLTPLFLYSFGILVAFFSVLIRALFFENLDSNIIDIIRLLTYFFVFSALLLCMTKEDTFTAFNFLNKLILVAAIVNIPIVIFDKFLLWEKWWMRSGSIFFHPNSGGALFGFALLFTLFNKKSFESNLLRYTAIILFAFGLFFSFSRGSLIAVVIALLALGFCKKPKVTSIIISLLTFIIIFGIKPIVSFIEDNFLFYRFLNGWAERDIMWLNAFEWLRQNSFLGMTQNTLREMIASVTINNYQSTHNSYIDSALLFGIPFVILIFVIYGLSLMKSFKENNLIFCLSIFYIINSNTLSSSVGFSPLIPGTLGIHPFILTLLILFPFQKSLNKTKKKKNDK